MSGAAGRAVLALLHFCAGFCVAWGTRVQKAPRLPRARPWDAMPRAIKGPWRQSPPPAAPAKGALQATIARPPPGGPKGSDRTPAHRPAIDRGPGSGTMSAGRAAPGSSGLRAASVFGCAALHQNACHLEGAARSAPRLACLGGTAFGGTLVFDWRAHPGIATVWSIMGRAGLRPMLIGAADFAGVAPIGPINMAMPSNPRRSELPTPLLRQKTRPKRPVDDWHAWWMGAGPARADRPGRSRKTPGRRELCWKDAPNAPVRACGANVARHPARVSCRDRDSGMPVLVRCWFQPVMPPVAGLLRRGREAARAVHPAGPGRLRLLGPPCHSHPRAPL